MHATRCAMVVYSASLSHFLHSGTAARSEYFKQGKVPARTSPSSLRGEGGRETSAECCTATSDDAAQRRAITVVKAGQSACTDLSKQLARRGGHGDECRVLHCHI
jgi:hypothetical protein